MAMDPTVVFIHCHGLRVNLGVLGPAWGQLADLFPVSVSVPAAGNVGVLCEEPHQTLHGRNCHPHESE